MIDVCAVIERETGQTVTERTMLEDLTVDSLEYLELMLTLERESGVSPSSEQLDSVQTVGGLMKAYS